MNTTVQPWNGSQAQWRKPQTQPMQQDGALFSSTLSSGSRTNQGGFGASQSPAWANQRSQQPPAQSRFASGQPANTMFQVQGGRQTRPALNDMYTTQPVGPAGNTMFQRDRVGRQMTDQYSTQPVGPNAMPQNRRMLNDMPYTTGQMQPHDQRGGGQYPLGSDPRPDGGRPGGGAPFGGPMPGDWNYNTPVPGALQPGQQANFGNQMNRPGSDAEWDWYRQNSQEISNWLPLAQFEQNRYQYGQDFNEAQRRYNQEFGWQQQQDQFNMGLSGRQQQMAEWQAGEAARQWNQQFGYTQQQDAREFQLANDQLSVERAYREGLISNEQRNLALQELTQQQDYALGNRQADIEAAYRQGMITNEQRSLSLQALKQQQDNALGQGQLQFSRDELAALQQWRGTEAGLRQQELDNNMLAARYSAFGRSQAPAQGRYVRNW